MGTIFVIAKNTFKQTIRDKILYGILVFASIFLGSSIILSTLSLGENLFIIKSFGLAGIYIFSLVITLFLGASIVNDELERKTSYFLLSKPASRADILVGKFLGLLGSVGVITLLMSGAYIFILTMIGGGFNAMVLLAIAFQLLEMAILIGAMILFSSFTTPLASVIYTILILYIGHLLYYIKDYISKSESAIKYVLVGAYYVFPNLEKFNIRDAVIHNVSITPQDTMLTIGYAITYSFLLLFLASTLLNRREL